MVIWTKKRKAAVVLAFISAFSPVPIAGIHKFYLGQPLWGIVYLLIFWTPLPRVASIIDALLYWLQGTEAFDRNFNTNTALSAVSPASVTATPGTLAIDPTQVSAITDAVRHLDQLRQDGLLSEYEFEQKRRQLLDQI